MLILSLYHNRCLLCSSCYLECLPQGDPINILPFLPALAYHSFPLHCNIPTNICFSQTLLMYYILKRTPFSEVQKKEGPNDRPPKADSWGSSARAVGKGLSSPYGLIWASLQQQLTSKQEHPENRLWGSLKLQLIPNLFFCYKNQIWLVWFRSAWCQDSSKRKILFHKIAKSKHQRKIYTRFGNVLTKQTEERMLTNLYFVKDMAS